MATRRLALRNRVSVSTTEQEAQLDDLPEARQTPSKTKQCSDRVSVSPSTVGIQEVPKDISPRRSPRFMGTLKSPAALHWKKSSLCCTTPSQEEETINGNSTLTENDELPKLRLTETPGAKLEKSVPRKSLRIAKLQNLYPTGSIDSNCLGGSGTKPEHVAASCEPAVVKQNEMQTPKRKKKTEAIKADQENLEMIMIEGKVSRQSPCVTANSPVPEQESLSLKAIGNDELHSQSNSEDAAGTDSKPSFLDKEVQTVIWKMIIGAEEELKAQDPETKESLLLQDTSPVKSPAAASPVKSPAAASPVKSPAAASPVKSPAAASPIKSPAADVKETPPIKIWNLRSKNLKLGDVWSNIEEVKAGPLTSSAESSGEKVMKKQETEKVKVKEADKIIEEANDQVTETTQELGQETEEKCVKKRKEVTTSGHQLIVSNLDSSKTFCELQIAVIRFFMEKELSVTSIGIKKSRKCGLVTFLTRKDLIQALQSDGEELLGRALRLRRPEQIDKSWAIGLIKKKKKYSAFRLRKRKTRAVSTKKRKKSSASPIKKKKMIEAKKQEEAATSVLRKKKKRKKIQQEGEKREEDESFAPPSPQKKGKVEEKVVLDEREDKAAVLQKKNKKKRKKEVVLDEREDKAAVLQKKNEEKLEKAELNKEREEEKEDTASPPKKKKKKHKEKGSSPKAVLNEEGEEKEEAAPPPKKKKRKNQEKVALSGKREEEEVHSEPLKMEKKKHRSKTSWCLYLQKIGFQEKKSKMKAAIGNFLNERSISYKEIVLYRSRSSACIELHCEGDLNKALKLDTHNVFGQAVSLNKVEKLGALDAEGDCRTLYIRSLPSEVSAKNLKKLYEKVSGVWIQENQKSSKRFALVAFKTTEAADGALSKCEIECKGNLIQLQSVHQRSKEKKKILMVKNLPCPLSKTYLKSLFTDAENVRVPEENDNQSQGIAYIEYRTAKGAKAALTQFKNKGFQGQAIRIDSLEDKKERSKKRLLQQEKKKRREKTGEAKKKGSLEKKLFEEKKKSKKYKADLLPSSNSLFPEWNSSPKATLDELKSTFKGSIGAKIHSSKKRCA